MNLIYLQLTKKSCNPFGKYQQYSEPIFSERDSRVKKKVYTTFSFHFFVENLNFLRSWHQSHTIPYISMKVFIVRVEWRIFERIGTENFRWESLNERFYRRIFIKYYQSRYPVVSVNRKIICLKRATSTKCSVIADQGSGAWSFRSEFPREYCTI